MPTDDAIADRIDDEPDCTELGKIVWHSSEEDGGPDVGRSIGLGEGRMLWFGAISRDLYDDAGPEAVELGSDYGTWIVLFGPKDTQVIGKAVDNYVGEDLLTVLSAALRTAKPATETVEAVGIMRVDRLMRVVDAASTSAAPSGLEEENKRLREALQPFVFGSAEMEQILWGKLPDSDPGTISVRLGDFRRARAALSGTGGGK